MSEKHRTRPRSSYNNIQSYDDELALVLELLEGAKSYENDLLDVFEEACEKLIKLYKDEFPFYFKNGADQKKLNELYMSLITGPDGFETKISKALDEIERQTRELEIERLTAWLILDYVMTEKATVKSLKEMQIPNQVVTLSLNRTQKKELIEKPWCSDKKTYLDRVREATSKMDKDLRLVIYQGIRRGWSIERMTQVFRNITGTAAYKAARLIRTETMAVYSKVTKEMYLENGIEYIEIIGDAACGGICTDYVGEVIPLREAELGDDLPPYHPNCACSFCSYTDFSEEEKELDSEE